MDYGCVTGNKQVLVRGGFAECDIYGFGYWCAALGNLDAPDFIPQGSVICFNSAKPHPVMSVAHRDGENRPAGAQHDV